MKEFIDRNSKADHVVLWEGVEKIDQWINKCLKLVSWIFVVVVVVVVVVVGYDILNKKNITGTCSPSFIRKKWNATIKK